MKRRTKRLLSLLLALVLVCSLLPAGALAAGTDIVWAGAANYNAENNQVTSIALPTESAYTMEKWAYPLNTAADNWGAYYAGQPVIVGGYLYATGGGKLHKVDITTGVGQTIAETAGSSESYYDYLCYADDMLIVSTAKKLEAFSLTGTSLGSVSGSYGNYHPVQYYDGHIVCNGWIYKLEKQEGSVSFTQVGEGTINGDAFNWSSGVFLSGKFYVAAKTTVYVVDYKTNTVTDSYLFDAERTASHNLQGGVAYDSSTKRLYWGTYTYDTKIHSIKVNTDGTLDAASYLSTDAGQNTTCIPVISGGRVYLAGQSGKISVLNAENLALIYNAATGASKIQSTPIVSTSGGTTKVYVQGYDGHLYVMTDNGTDGAIVKLAETKNYTGVNYPSAYEQIAMDNAGNLYCYNESGYLFCYSKTACEVPSITVDLSGEQVKYALNSQATALTIEASVSDGGVLSYQWQSSTDKLNWSNIEGAADQSSYTPLMTSAATTYYRCVVTNTKGGATASVVSTAANILVKILSNNTTLHVMVNGSNSATADTPVKAQAGANEVLYVENRSAKTTNIWLGTVSDGTVTSFEILRGLSATASTPSFTSKSSSNVFDETIYNGYYRSTSFTLPIVAKVVVTAEDEITTKTHFVVITSGTAGQYIVAINGFSADSSAYYNAETGISFTAAGQTVTLTPQTSSIGTGDKDVTPAWTSSDVTVAKVDSNGVVTSVGGGNATITASYGRVTATCSVTSTAAAHNVHTYEDGACSVCGTKEPGALKAYFTLVGQNGDFAVAKDGTTEMYKVELSVSDIDADGTVTFNDAFLTAHQTHSANGSEDFESSDGWMKKLWGVQTNNVSYTVNDAAAATLLTALRAGDEVAAYFYRDTSDYSDLYTYFSSDAKVSVNNEVSFTVNGLAVMSGTAAIPRGATVNVYDETGAEISTLSTTVGDAGTFSISFPTAGDYTIEVTGTCTYSGSVWDNSLGGYAQKVFTNAPVVPSRMLVEVMPYASATVYVTLSDATGDFVTGKDGTEIYRVPIMAEDDNSNPDGQVSLYEVAVALHEKYHADGASAFVGSKTWITKLWGISTSNVGYYLNDVYMTGSGTKTGTNGREFKDELLATVVSDGDSFNLFIYQDNNWSDYYTWFAPVSASAIAGVAKKLTVKGSYWGREMAPSGAAVKVKNASGQELTELNTTVGNDGTFTITFPTAGTYAVQVQTGGSTYAVPSRCTVHVTAATAGTGQDESVYISVVDPAGTTYAAKKAYIPNSGETAYSLLLRTGLNVQATTDHQYGGVYVESIEGLGEFDEGNQSGWMYRVNGVYPDYSASLYELSAGDYVEWLYTRELGTDIGGGVPTTSADRKAAEAVMALIEAIGTVSKDSGDAIRAARTAYDALTDTQKKLVTNYDKLTAAEKALDELDPQPVGLPFEDVTGHWALDAIRYAYEKGLFKGISEDVFGPNEEMTRAMLVTVLYRLDQEPEVDYQALYQDILDGKWYSQAVIWADSNKLVEGYGAGSFGPDDPITREQLAVILYRYAQYKGYDMEATVDVDLPGYGDYGDISDWALPALEWACGVRLINGRTADSLAPGETATRAEVATILMRFLETVATEKKA